jgi:hypothetical protein
LNKIIGGIWWVIGSCLDSSDVEASAIMLRETGDLRMGFIQSGYYLTMFGYCRTIAVQQQT